MKPLKYFVVVLLMLAVTSCEKASKPLVLKSSPAGAGVWAGDMLVGNTPIAIKQDMGDMELVLRSPGCVDTSVKVSPSLMTIQTQGKKGQFTEEEEGFVAVIDMPRLQADTKTLLCISIPAGAEVLLNGESKGLAPLELHGLEPKPYEVSFKMKDRETVVKNIVWKEGEEKLTVEAKLPSLTLGFYRAKLQAEPLWILHYADLGHHLILEGELQEGMEVYKKGLELLLEKKAKENAHRLWSEINRVIVVQYVYGDAETVKQARALLLNMLKSLWEKYPDINDPSFYYNYIDCADANNQRQDAQEKFEKAYKKWPNDKRLKQYLKRGFTP